MNEGEVHFLRLADLAERCLRFNVVPATRRNRKTLEWQSHPAVYLLEDLDSLWMMFGIWEDQVKGIATRAAKPRSDAPSGYRSWAVAVQDGAIRLIHRSLNAIARVIPLPRPTIPKWLDRSLAPYSDEFPGEARDALVELIHRVRNTPSFPCERALEELDIARMDWARRYHGKWPTGPDFPELRDEFEVADHLPTRSPSMEHRSGHSILGDPSRCLLRDSDRRGALVRLATSLEPAESGGEGKRQRKSRLHKAIKDLTKFLDAYHERLQDERFGNEEALGFHDLRELFDVSLDKLSTLVRKHESLAKWICEQNGGNDSGLLDSLVSEEPATSISDKAQRRDCVAELRRLLELCEQSESCTEAAMYRSLWQVPYPMPSDTASVLAERIVQVREWLTHFGDLERARSLGERISKWLADVEGGKVSVSPLAAPLQPSLDDAMHPYDVERIHRVGCVNEVIEAALNRATIDELTQSVRAMPTRFHFFGLQDWECEYRGANHDSDCANQLVESLRVEHELLMAGAMTLANEGRAKKEHRIDRDNRSLHWFGESFDAIEKNPFLVLEVLYDAFEKGIQWVSLEEIRNKCSDISAIQTDYSRSSNGLAEVFTVRVFDISKKQRVRKKLDVWKIVDVRGRRSPFYRLKSPVIQNPD